MNVTKAMVDEASRLVGDSNIGSVGDGEVHYRLVGHILISNAILECDKTLATIAQKVLDTLP
jgi:hypothetical protein